MVGLFINTLPARVPARPLGSRGSAWAGASSRTSSPSCAASSTARSRESQALERSAHAASPLFESHPRLRELPDGGPRPHVKRRGSMGYSGLRAHAREHELSAHPGRRPGDDAPRLRVSYDRARFDAGCDRPAAGPRRVTLLEGLASDPHTRASPTYRSLLQAEGPILAAGPANATARASACLHRALRGPGRAHARTPSRARLRGQAPLLRRAERRANRAGAPPARRSASARSAVGLCLERSLEMVVAILAVAQGRRRLRPARPGLPRRAARLHARGRRMPVAADHARPAARRAAGAEACAGAAWTPTAERSRPQRASHCPARGDAGRPRPTSSTPRAPPARPRACWSRTTTSRACSTPPTPGSASARTTCGRSSTPTPSTSRSGSSGARCSTAAGWWSSRTGQPLARGFHALLRRERVTVLNQTPSAFRQLIAADGERRPSSPLALRYVVFGGEALELPACAPWFERHGDERAAAGQHVRHHRDHRPRHLPAAARSTWSSLTAPAARSASPSRTSRCTFWTAR